jgi:hypothetical protein
MTRARTMIKTERTNVAVTDYRAEPTTPPLLRTTNHAAVRAGTKHAQSGTVGGASPLLFPLGTAHLYSISLLILRCALRGLPPSAV